RAFTLMALGACAAGSGPGGGFDIHFPDNRPNDMAAVVTAIAQHPASAMTAMVVITPAPPAHGMTAFALPQGTRAWQTALRIDAKPVIAGSVVISHADGQVIAWDAQSGAEKWRAIDHGYSLIGASGDSNQVALS